ncbi:MAG: lactonase family protein [bacterium]|nr:lactonase family protein [bacterium]
MSGQNSETLLVYVGTYTRKEAHVEGKSRGIHIYRMDLSSGKMAFVNTCPGVVNPSFLDLHPNGEYLYSVSEVAEADGKPGGGISALSIDPETGELTLLNQQSSVGQGPCYVSVEATGRYVLVANYGSGSVAMLPIRQNGALGEASGFVQHEGSSVNPSRQAGPHAHSILPGPENRYAFAADLGLDQIVAYEMDLEAGKLTSVEPAKAQAGCGPRHFDFHPNGRFAYLINELNSTTIVYAYDSSNGSMREIQTISTVPEGYTETNYCADIHVAPSGRFVYGSNRGHDSIVIFKVDEETGKLTTVGYEPTQGEYPRNFGIDPTGQFLLAANQNSDSIVVFRADSDSGTLTPTGQVVEAPTPVCVKFLSR